MKMNRMRKRIHIAAIFLAIVMCAHSTLSLFAAGAEDTIQIRTADDLLKLAENCTLDTWSVGKTVVLQADISLKDVESFSIPTFGGIFDGNGYSITGFSIIGNYSSIGFFGVLQEDAVVRNLKIEGSVCPTGDAAEVGGIAGINYGSILNCSYTGYVAGDDNIGGIAGINETGGEIKRCQANAVVSGNHSTGGIAGVNHGVLNNCKNAGDINTQTAGITYEIDDLTIDNMKNLNSTENVAVHMDTGGIVGLSDGKIYYCTNSGVVGYPHVGYNVGGIAGRLHQGYIQGCTNTGNVLGRKDVGGIAGQMEPFLEIQYLTDKFQELDREADKFLNMCEDTFQHVDSYGGEALELLQSISGNLDRASGAAGELSTASGDLLHIYNQELNGLNGNLKEFGDELSKESSSGNHGGENRSDVPSVSGNDWSNLPGVSGNNGSNLPGGGDWNGNLSTGGGSQMDKYSDMLEKLIRNSAGHMDTMLGETQSRESLFRDNLQILNAELDAAGNSMKKLSDVLEDGANQTSADADALSEQAKVLKNLISGIRDDLFEVEGISVRDISGEEETSEHSYDTSAFQKGKITQCENRAKVEADICVGGIVGQIATEYDIDPEKDISVVGTESLQIESTVKAVVRGSRNYGEVTAKKDYAGGILGKTEIGAVISCESYGDVSSTGGNYVGGIAGMSGAAIRGCFTKCTLAGNKYIGGVIGSGLEESDSEVGNLVLGCYTFVDIDEFEQYAGAVAGVNSGNFLENYFVSEKLQGVERTNYSGKAEPIRYSDLLKVEGLPEEFKQLTLEFVVEDEVVKTVPFVYGESFDDSVFPEIPEKEGYYGEWDIAELKNLMFDTVVTAVYSQAVSALPGPEQRENNRRIFFVEGQFEEEDSLECIEQEITTEDILTKDYFAFIKNKTRPEMKINREVVEQWRIRIPDDGLASHVVRYLPPDGSGKKLEIFVRQQDGSWKKTQETEVGSYLCFYVEGQQAELAVVSTVSVWWMWLVVFGILFLILFLICKLVWNIIRCCRRKRVEQEDGTAAERKETAAAEEDSDDAVGQGELKEADNAGEQGESKESNRVEGKMKETDDAGTPEERKEEKKTEEQKKTGKTKRRKRILIAMISIFMLIIGLAAAAILYFQYQFGSSMAVYNLLKDYAEQPELCMEFDVLAKIGTEESEAEVKVIRTELEGHPVFCIEQQGMALYYADGVVFLENGKAFRAGSLIPDYSTVLPHMAELYHSVDVTVSGDKEEQIYSIITKQETVRLLLEILMPAFADQFSEIQIANVDLAVSGDKLSSIHFSSSGTLNDSPKTAVSVTADIAVREVNAEEVSIPQAVKEAVIGGQYEIGEIITEDLFRLLTAWSDFNHREKLAARLLLKAECGPLTVNDTLQMFRVTENDTRINCIRKNAQSIYFTEGAICDKSGHKISSRKEPIVESAKLLEFVYQLCLNSNFGCMETNGSYIYTLMLDNEGAKTVAQTIVPETKDMDLEYGTSSVQITVKDEKIVGMRFVCDGSIELLHVDTPVSVTGELLLEADGTLDDFSIPGAVLDALTADK